MLVEIAIGDAYGAGFEYCDRTFIEKYHRLLGYIDHPWHGLRPGCYTDDTQMSMALAELILSDADWTEHSVAGCFVEAFHRDQRKGYSNPLHALLVEATSPELFLESIHSNSVGNGAAMRSVPIGIYADLNEVKAKSEIQARVTHNTDSGVASAVAVSLMSHYFLYRLGEKQDLPSFLNHHVPFPDFDWRQPWNGRVESYGVTTALGALWVVVRTNSLRDVLDQSILLSGDVDTVAAIALGVASCSKEHQYDLDSFFYEGLENETYGLDYLSRLDKTMAKRFSLPWVCRNNTSKYQNALGSTPCNP